MNYVSDHLPCLYFIIFSIHVSCFFVIPLLGCSMLLPSCGQNWHMWIFPMFEGFLCHTHGTISSFIVVFLFSGVGCPLRSVFFSCVYGCPPPLLVTLTWVVSTAAATVRLHISIWSAQILSSFCLRCIFKFPFLVVISVNSTSRAAITNEILIKASSILPCLTLLELPFPAAPNVFSSSSWSRYASWKCALNRTHARSFSAMMFHIRYLDLCLAAKGRPGPRVATRWWEKEGLDLEGMWKVTLEAQQTEGEEEK